MDFLDVMSTKATFESKVDSDIEVKVRKTLLFAH